MAGSVFITLFLGLFLAIGVAILSYGGWSYVNGSKAAIWPVVEGEILDSRLDVSSDSDGDSYSVKLEYKYSAGGMAYTGERIAFGYAGSSSRGYHNDILKKLPTGARIGVRYDPANPSRAVLAYGANQSIYFMLVFGAIWTIFVIGFIAIIWLSGSNFGSIVDKLIIYS